MLGCQVSGAMNLGHTRQHKRSTLALFKGRRTRRATKPTTGHVLISTLLTQTPSIPTSRD